MNYRSLYHPRRRNYRTSREGYTYLAHRQARERGFDLRTAEGRLLAAIFGIG